MNKKFFLAGLVTLGLLLMLISGIASAQSPASVAGDSPTEVDASIDATVNSKISYQGMLTESGQPVTGSRDLLFRLYSNSTCTTQVGSDIVKNSVSITDGLFSIELPVTHSHFNGQGLWLRTRVGASTWLGCQEILPVPYALSLRPGAIIEGAPGANWLLEARTGTGGSDMKASLVGSLAAVRGVTSLGVGIYGEAHGALGL
ncbi:MAG: hypothetical protein JW862_09070, partial [Anaerolineales bacterium]|nr:hypothetical protein [Anaerolineales bacterium]